MKGNDSMGTPTFLERVKRFIGDIAWAVFLRSMGMKEEEYIALLVNLDKVLNTPEEIELLKAAESMASAIRVWNQAKKARETWIPIPGQLPPAQFVMDAKQANLMLESALKSYEAALVGWQSRAKDSPKSI
jgi:hypothetical protein